MAKKVDKSSRDSRLNRDESDSRALRETKDRVITQDRELNDSQRLDALRSQRFQTHLPDLEELPGYHVCWLTTTNPRDPIHGRLRLGYELIRAEEMPGYEHSSLKTGEYAGCIGVNEMVAAKLPIHLYQEYMTELHYTMPNQEEEKLTEAVREAQQRAAQINAGALLLTEEGTAELGKAPPKPDFTGGLREG